MTLSVATLAAIRFSRFGIGNSDESEWMNLKWRLQFLPRCASRVCRFRLTFVSYASFQRGKCCFNRSTVVRQSGVVGRHTVF